MWTIINVETSFPPRREKEDGAYICPFVSIEDVFTTSRRMSPLVLYEIAVYYKSEVSFATFDHKTALLRSFNPKVINWPNVARSGSVKTINTIKSRIMGDHVF